MKLTYLGSAAAEAIPGMFCECRFCETARRLGGKELRRRSGAVINGELMLDFSPDVNAACAQLGIRLSDIKNVLFTHSHSDHCYVGDLEFRRCPAYCILPEERAPLHLYGNRAVEEKVRGEFPDTLKSGFDFTFITPYKPYKIGNYTVTALSALHNPPEDAYIYLIDDGKNRLLYAHDTGMLLEQTFEYLKGIRIDIVSLDCTCGFAPQERGHMGFMPNVKVKKILTKNGCADEKTIFISNHFSHNGLRAPDVDWTYDYFTEMAKPYGIIMGYDGLTVEV